VFLSFFFFEEEVEAVPSLTTLFLFARKPSASASFSFAMRSPTSSAALALVATAALLSAAATPAQVSWGGERDRRRGGGEFFRWRQL
jgi:hypothetical protein